ncbi:MAG: arginine deiminase family protein [Anaerolineales bacterium]
MFKRAIVRIPGISMIHGLTTANLGIPDYEKALAQHTDYIEALEKSGLEVLVLGPDEQFPDSTFVEDVALLTKNCAIITNPGAPSRKGETAAIKDVLKGFYVNIEEVLAPGTVEGGDIMMVGSHFYIGLSERTNVNGAEQVIRFLENYGLSGSMVELEETLHLKTGVAYLEQNNLAASGEFLKKEEFQDFNLIEIAEDESYASNCVWVNDRVLIPQGYPKARESIIRAGYTIIEVEVSEFQKLDGGLSCLSLRF